MKILNERVALLLDYEVLQHLEELKHTYNWTFTPEEDKKSRKRRFTGAGPDLEAITRDITLYLEKNAAGTVPSEKNFAELVAFLNRYDLMKAEKLQIVNSLPRSMVHLHGLVEECGARFDEDTCELILGKIDELMPLKEEEGDEAEEEHDDAAESEE